VVLVVSRIDDTRLKMKKRFAVLLSVSLVLASLITLGADWPQWRGPNRDGISAETGLLKTWPKGGPPLIWTFRDAGAGYSAPAVAGGRVYMMGARGDSEYLYALDAASAKEVWSLKIGPVFDLKQISQWGGGPRATPTVDGGLVFALGGQGELVCAAIADGKEHWRLDIFKELQGEISPNGGNDWNIGWGYTSAPLADGEQVVCVPGGKEGTLAALEKKTGKVLWRSKELTDPATYSSPIAAEIGGVRQYILTTDQHVAGLAATDGRLLWEYKKKPTNSILIPTPILHESSVYTAVGDGCELIRLSAEGGKFKTTKVYANRNMVNHLGGTVLIDNRVYGYSDGKGWVCQDFKTGKIVWSEKRKFGAGSLVYADGHLYCYGQEDGVMALVRASPDGWKEDGRFEIPAKSKLGKPDSRIWTHPVIANRRLYLRDQELLFCYELGNHAVGSK
jgi:outer membrane protein assembly factor BamB